MDPFAVLFVFWVSLDTGIVANIRTKKSDGGDGPGIDPGQVQAKRAGRAGRAELEDRQPKLKTMASNQITMGSVARRVVPPLKGS
jgi:hypothetical protein